MPFRLTNSTADALSRMREEQEDTDVVMEGSISSLSTPILALFDELRRDNAKNDFLLKMRVGFVDHEDPTRYSGYMGVSCSNKDI